MAFGNRDQVLLGYVYILTHPGVPTVFWDHYFYWNLKGKIKELISIRKKANIDSASPVEIIQAKQDLYVAKINDNLLVKIGKGTWSAGPEFAAPIVGHNYAIWLRSPLYQDQVLNNSHRYRLIVVSSFSNRPTTLMVNSRSSGNGASYF